MRSVAKIIVGLATIGPAVILAATDGRSNTKENGLKYGLAKEIDFFDRGCGLEPASDRALYDYIDKRLGGASSWQVDWSTRKILATVVAPDVRTALTDASSLVTAIRSLREGTRLDTIRSTFDVDEAKQQGQFVDKRTCSDRYAAGAHFKAAVPVASASAGGAVSFKHEGSIVLMHGMWRSNVDALLERKDRTLYVELYEKYQPGRSDSIDQNKQHAVVAWIKGFTVLQTKEKQTSLALDGAIAGGGSLGFVSGDLEVETSVKAGNAMRLDTMTTYVTARSTISFDRKNPGVPELALAKLPHYSTVRDELGKNVTLQRDGSWTGEAGLPASLGIVVSGVTEKECRSLTIELLAGAESVSRVDVGKRHWANQSCQLRLATNAMTSPGAVRVNLRAKYSDITLGDMSDEVAVNVGVSAKIGEYGRPVDAPDKQRWRVALIPSNATASMPKKADDLSAKIVFGCSSGNKEFLVSFVPSLMYFESASVPIGCSATPPRIWVKPANGTSILIQVDGSLTPLLNYRATSPNRTSVSAMRLLLRVRDSSHTNATAAFDGISTAQPQQGRR